MSIIELLRNKLSQLTKDFHHLIHENRQLKAKIEHLQNQNDKLTRDSEDLLLSINSRLKQEEDS